MSKDKKNWLSFSENWPEPETGELIEIKLKTGETLKGHFMDYGFETNQFTIDLENTPTDDIKYRIVPEIQPDQFVENPDLEELKKALSEYAEDVQLGYPVSSTDRDKILNVLLKTFYGSKQFELFKKQRKHK